VQLRKSSPVNICECNKRCARNMKRAIHLYTTDVAELGNRKQVPFFHVSW